MTTLIIITGASRGLGAALASLAVEHGHAVLAIARSQCTAGDWLPLDLADCNAIEPALSPLLSARRDQFDRHVLVNNAATLDPIGDAYDAAMADRHLRINLTAPIMLSRVFLRTLAAAPSARRIINISSGAAQRPFDGWSLYCAGKAGLEHFARCVALEQQRADHPADIVNVSPGVIDTDMQARIRAASATEFPAIERFRQLHTDGELATPEMVAGKLLRGALATGRYNGATLSIDAFAARG